MNDKYISLKLAEKLFENGCELESEYKYRGKKLIVTGAIGTKIKSTEFASYDIMNEICVKYAKEFFGAIFFSPEEITKINGCCMYQEGAYSWTIHPEWILNLLQQGLKHKAEKYIWEVCSFNPKNNK